MLTIWKFELTIEARYKNLVEMPIGSKILSAQMQDGKLMVWALVMPKMKKVNRIITVHGTGVPLQGLAGAYVGTTLDGEYVWHVFDEGEVGIPTGGKQV